MENKQAAIREIGVAVRLMRNQDYNGARENLLRAKRLFPQLENIDAMINVCRIVLCASNRATITTNWYWVLQINANANESHITSAYHAHTKSLEPIKNMFPGTDSALIVLNNAFSILSDRNKRSSFDSIDLLGPQTPKKLTRGSRDDYRPIPISRPNASYYDFCGNRKPGIFAKGQIWAVYDEEEGLPRRYARINRIEQLTFRLGVTWLKPVPANEDEKTWCEVGLPVVCGGFDLKGGNVVVNKLTVFSHVVSRVQNLEIEQVEICPKKGEVWAVYEDWRPRYWCKDPKARKNCGYLMVEILTGYSKHAGVTIARLAKVAGFRSVFERCIDTSDGSTFKLPAEHLVRFSHNVPIFRFKGGELGGVSAGMLELDPLAVPGDMVEDITKSSGGSSSSDCSDFTKHAQGSPLVDLDPEIISIKCKWSRNDFTADQIWAVYDGPDTMPRRYVIVNNVISATEVCTSFLEPHPMLADEIFWVKENLPFGCGLFKAGRTTIMKMSQFSHVVTGESCTKTSLYRIYPKKGEVWAIYKNWHPKWKNSHYGCQQCLIVEVLSDFSEGDEMKITSLVEVNDSMTFFQRHLCNGFELIRKVPRMDMLSFSHQIPCFVVPKIESHGFPEGSLHLEPDALPPKHAN